MVKLHPETKIFSESEPGLAKGMQLAEFRTVWKGFRICKVIIGKITRGTTIK